MNSLLNPQNPSMHSKNRTEGTHEGTVQNARLTQRQDSFRADKCTMCGLTEARSLTPPLGLEVGGSFPFLTRTTLHSLTSGLVPCTA